MAIFHARDVDIRLQAANSNTITTSGTLLSFFGSAVVVSTAKSLELDEGEYDFDQQNFMGADSDGFQNQAKVRKPKGPASARLTVDIDTLNSIIALTHDSSSSTASTTRYLNGNVSSANRKKVDMLIRLDNGSERWSYALKSAESIKPAAKMSGPDGEAEYELEFKCLAKDFIGPETN